MHFALPPRKTSGPPPYTRVKNASNQQSGTIRYIGYFVLSLLTIYLVFSYFPSGSTVEEDGDIRQDSDVVIVTVLDESKMSKEYIHMIKTNREDYAARHGYTNFFTNISTYQHLTDPSPSSWSLVPALRHALTIHPKCDYLWSLSPHALITNPSVSLHSHIFSRLSSLMLKDIPVVPPDSVIHTFSHLKPSQAYLILTQDMDNLAHTSLLLRNTDNIPVKSDESKDHWSHFLLDAWFDPLYRAYSFQKAENHALEHVVQWHPTLLAKVVIIEQRLLNSYNFQSQKKMNPATNVERIHDSMWQSGDLVINLKGCSEVPTRDCEKEMQPHFEQWENFVRSLDAKSSTTG